MKVCISSALNSSLHISPFFYVFASLSSQLPFHNLTPLLVLTSRKHGIATVWLVATLGSKSSTKKITRKAILDVDVKKACNTILEPDAPMALRLQSNLLYGVSRVYGQQVGYVLSDTIHVEQNLRGLGKMLTGSLDLEIVKVK